MEISRRGFLGVCTSAVAKHSGLGSIVSAIASPSSVTSQFMSPIAREFTKCQIERLNYLMFLHVYDLCPDTVTEGMVREPDLISLYSIMDFESRERLISIRDSILNKKYSSRVAAINYMLDEAAEVETRHIIGSTVINCISDWNENHEEGFENYFWDLLTGSIEEVSEIETHFQKLYWQAIGNPGQILDMGFLKELQHACRSVGGTAAMALNDPTSEYFFDDYTDLVEEVEIETKEDLDLRLPGVSYDCMRVVPIPWAGYPEPKYFRPELLSANHALR